MTEKPRETQAESHVVELKEKVNNSSLMKHQITVTSLQTGEVKFRHTQKPYNSNAVYTLPDFANLSESLRRTLRRLYDNCNPRPMCDLVQGNEPALTLATMQFKCSKEDLLCGLVETIYAMRNALLHGEIRPNAKVLACYEPAFRIVMQFLNCIR